MRTAITLILLFLTPLVLAAQESYDKERLLNARARQREKNKNREYCAKLTFSKGISDNRCFETYPSEVIDWGKGFSEGLAKITVDGKAGFINTKGEIVVEPKLPDAGPFSEGRAPFESKNGKWGYIDRTGAVVIKPTFDWAFTFREGLGLVQSGQLWGYIDRTGKFVIEPSFEEATSFSEGFAAVGSYNKEAVNAAGNRGLWERRFIDRSGKPVFDRSFDGVSRSFTGGLAIVSRSLGYSNEFKGVISETYVIDKTGKEIWKLNSHFVTWFSDGLIVVAVGKSDKGRDSYGYLDTNGRRVSEQTFAYISGFIEGLAPAKKDFEGKYGFINRDGKFVIDAKFSSARSFSEGLAGVEEQYEGYGFIDKTGAWVIKPQFHWVWPFHEGFALVAPKGNRETHEKTGYIDRTGTYIWKPTK